MIAELHCVQQQQQQRRGSGRRKEARAGGDAAGRGGRQQAAGGTAGRLGGQPQLGGLGPALLLGRLRRLPGGLLGGLLLRQAQLPPPLPLVLRCIPPCGAASLLTTFLSAPPLSNSTSYVKQNVMYLFLQGAYGCVREESWQRVPTRCDHGRGSQGERSSHQAWPGSYRVRGYRPASRAPALPRSAAAAPPPPASSPPAGAPHSPVRPSHRHGAGSTANHQEWMLNVYKFSTRASPQRSWWGAPAQNASLRL